MDPQLAMDLGRQTRVGEFVHSQPSSHIGKQLGQPIQIPR